MAKAAERSDKVDPSWPEGDHPVTELSADRTGALSPFGDVTFPVDPETLPYEHPVTEINK